jgi:hypothetical protein
MCDDCVGRPFKVIMVLKGVYPDRCELGQSLHDVPLSDNLLFAELLLLCSLA